MEIYNATGVRKTTQIRVTKSFGMLLIMSNQPFIDLLNEKISVYIERASGDNQHIATNISLKAFIGCAVFGEGKIIEKPDFFQAIAELSDEGSIPLQENESIVIQLSDLKDAKTYQLHTIETPVISQETVFYTEKVFLNGQKNRSYEVNEFDECMLLGDFEKVRLTYPTDQGTQTTEHSKLEIRAIAADLGLEREGSNQQIEETLINIVAVSEIEIFASNQVNLILRDINKIQ